MEEIIKVISKFLNKFNKEEIEGVLLYGSAVSGKLNAGSDIDLLIAINSKPGKQYVGCKVVDSYKVEYFIHDLDFLYDLALKQIEKNDLSYLTKFITSKIIYDKTGDFTNTIEKIKRLYDLPMRENHNNFTKKELFHIGNRIDDLKSVKNSNTFYVVYYDILRRIKELHTKINGLIVLPLGKMEKLFEEEDYLKYYISSDIHKYPDKGFQELFLKCLNIKDREKMIEDIKLLYKKSFEKENFDSDEFELEFDVNEGFGI